MTEVSTFIANAVAGAPPLSSDQVDRLRNLFDVARQRHPVDVRSKPTRTARSAA